MKYAPPQFSFVVLAAALLVAAAAPTGAIEWPFYETGIRGYPVLRSINGKRIADGEFVQWIANDALHVRITYTGSGGTRMEERVVLRQRPELMQQEWHWRETERGRSVRAFDVDFASGAATAAKLEKGEMKKWSDTLKVDRGHTFAGFGFSLAAKALRKKLIGGETVELKAIGFAPAPKVVTVALRYGGRDRIRMSGRTIPADRFVVHPKLPAIAKLFVKVPDATIWLTPPPAGFLRYEGTLAEPTDELIRIDLLPGGPSEPATPVATSGSGKR